MRPDEQSRLTVEIGTLSGIPAASAAARETYNGEGGWQVPLRVLHLRRMFNLTYATCVHTYTDVTNLRRVQPGFLQSRLNPECGLIKVDAQ
jgi:hypothetical protein